MRASFAALIAGPALASCAALAHANEPLATVAAAILDRGVCQAESWHRWSHAGGHEGWLLPACSVTGWLELAAGAARYREEDVGGHSLFLLRAKAVAYRDPDERFSLGFVGAVMRDGGHEARSSPFHEGVALGLVTFHSPERTLRVHMNGGIVYRRDDFTTGAWGVAAEYDVRDDWTLLAELFRDEPGRPKYQLGVRYVLVTDRVELFASGGDSLDRSAHGWFAKFGVRFQTWKLF